MAEATKTQSPYVRARQEWDERFGDQIKSRNNWRLAAFVSMGTTFLCVTGMVAIGYRSNTVPYVVALDDVGRAVPVIPAKQVAVKDVRLQEAVVARWVTDLRMIVTDAVAQRRLVDEVQTTGETINAEDVRAIATRRQSGHWASLSAVDSTDAPRHALHAVYDALVAAADFYSLRNLHKDGFDYPDATTMYRAYESELYRFDQLYRHFCESADTAEEQGWNIVKPLRVDIEAHYVTWYLTNLALSWGKFIEPYDGLLTHWQIDNVTNQYGFYDHNVQPWLYESENRRAFVIISDAFRYEAAQELTTELNGKYRFEATLSSQLGVLPSYTSLGMAALLPHKTLAYKGTDVLVEGKSSIAAERDGILQAVGGMALKCDELMAKKKEEGREVVKDKRNFGDAINRYFKLGRDLNQRDTIAVKHTVSGLLKLLYPNEEYDKDAVRRCLEYALEARRRVKEQLKKIGGMEFFDVHFSYIDVETLEEKFISVPEQGGGSLIPDGTLSPGVMHTVATGSGGHLGLYRLETQVTSGDGTLKTSGLGSNSAAKEAIKVGFDYFKANANRVSATIKPGDHDYHLHAVELHNTGPTSAMTLAAFVALCSGLFGKPIQQQMVILGSMSLGGNIVPVENLAEALQVAFDAGAKRLLLPMASVRDIPTIPGELFAKFQTGFYADPVDAVFKALGVQ